MSYVGVDYGSKRVGIAVSDERGLIAFPLEVVAEKDALNRVRRLIVEREAKGVVIGESKDFSGNDNAVMKGIEAFVADLKRDNIAVFLEPEFMTSAMAARHLAPDGSRKESPSQEHLDASAAALILQSFLDRGGAGTI